MALILFDKFYFSIIWNWTWKGQFGRSMWKEIFRKRDDWKKCIFVYDL